MNKYHTIEEVAEIAEVSIKTVRRHIASGNLPSEKRQGRYFIATDDVKSWLETGKSIEAHSIFDSAEAKPQADTVNWIDISDKWLFDGWSDTDYRNGYNFIDLFSGAGGSAAGWLWRASRPLRP